MTLQSRIPISEHAAAQEPSKLGLAPGETISVEDAIKAVVTRSANDIAVAIAEAIGHDESTFAEMMTRKAHALGMARTIYRNASGLPNDEQITTAHDLTILAARSRSASRATSAISRPTSSTTTARSSATTTICSAASRASTASRPATPAASGFNLLTSVHRDGRSLLAVVMGGRSAPARDQIMENLIDDHLAQGSTVRTATEVADASASDDRPAEPAAPVRPHPVVVAASVPTHLPATRPAQADAGEGDDADGDQGSTLRVSAVRPIPQTHSGAPTPIPRQPAAGRQAEALLADANPPAKKPDAGGARLVEGT